MKKTITPNDILSMDAYNAIREEKRSGMIETKKNRRVAVGPYATFYFENYDTMWLQVQEMLRIEKGGVAQLQDELAAYNPLIPQGHELVATVMMEIEDVNRRAAVLATLGGLETKAQIRIAGEVVNGEPERDLEYTSPEGKASSIVFVHFRLTPAQIIAFRKPENEIIVAIVHPNYSHMAVMPSHVKAEVVKDFIPAVPV
jgi:hypothetical protein